MEKNTEKETLQSQINFILAQAEREAQVTFDEKAKEAIKKAFIESFKKMAFTFTPNFDYNLFQEMLQKAVKETVQKEIETLKKEIQEIKKETKDTAEAVDAVVDTTISLGESVNTLAKTTKGFGESINTLAKTTKGLGESISDIGESVNTLAKTTKGFGESINTLAKSQEDITRLTASVHSLMIEERRDSMEMANEMQSLRRTVEEATQSIINQIRRSDYERDRIRW